MSLYPIDILDQMKLDNQDEAPNQPVPKPRFTDKNKKATEAGCSTSVTSQSMYPNEISSPPTYTETIARTPTSMPNLPKSHIYSKTPELTPTVSTKSHSNESHTSNRRESLSSPLPDNELKLKFLAAAIPGNLSNNDIKLAIEKKVKEKTTWSEKPLSKFAVVDSEDSVSYRITLISKVVKRSIDFEQVPLQAEYTKIPFEKRPALWEIHNQSHVVKVNVNGQFYLPTGDKKPSTLTHSDQKTSTTLFQFGKIHVCHKCDGKRFETCGKCKGYKKLICSRCNGRKIEQDGKKCTMCGGNGECKCTNCKATGKIDCPTCRTQGKLFVYPKLAVTVSVEKEVTGVLNDSVNKLKSDKLVDGSIKSTLVYTYVSEKNDGGDNCKCLVNKNDENLENDEKVAQFNTVNKVIAKMMKDKIDRIKLANSKLDQTTKSVRICWQRVLLERIPTCQVEYNVGKGKSLWLVVYGEDMKVHCDDSWPGSLGKKLFKW